ncbi:hypothetical protein G3N96_02710 [Burkholderia sp. Se-20373]|uniref:hypothetical protein n=1 Tax=Burkholderia sp. Se-20373 TaxID=2703898 RepID=UPI00197EDADB|nr:hypothetical protein [Burkholderia sp. Se-20373]MBN3744364.1 hypothetical protein [Burkholderia sp. Se-20373]
MAVLVCTATLIQAPPGLRTVYRMSPRLLQGFSQGLLEIAFATLLVLNYVGGPPHTSDRSPAADRWRRRLDGAQAWLLGAWHIALVHLRLDPDTGQVRAMLLTHQNVNDGGDLAELLGQIPGDERINVVGGTGPTTPNLGMP